MKLLTLTLIITFFFSFNLKAQTNNDSTENFRNYLAVNTSPLFTTIFGDGNKNNKFSVTYKRNYGSRNYVGGINYSTTAVKNFIRGTQFINSTSSNIVNRFFLENFDQVDIRLGFEEIRGNFFSRLHFGGDLIIGYLKHEKQYQDQLYTIDTSGHYNPDQNSLEYEGNALSSYFVAGIDINLGFDVFLSEIALITFQITPQFTYNTLLSSSQVDQFDQYNNQVSFFDANFDYFDVLLVFKF